MHKVLKEDPLPPSTLNVQVPRPFDAVVKKAIAKRPDDRFQTAREFADAIRAAAEGRDIAGPRQRPWSPNAGDTARTDAQRSPTERTQADDPDAGGSRRPRRARASRWRRTPAGAAATARQQPAIAVVGALAAIGVAVAGWLIVSRRSGPADRPPAAAAPATPAAQTAAAPAPTPASVTPVAAPLPPAAPGTLLITAVGLVDPTRPAVPGRQGA